MPQIEYIDSFTRPQALTYDGYYYTFALCINSQTRNEGIVFSYIPLVIEKPLTNDKIRKAVRECISGYDDSDICRFVYNVLRRDAEIVMLTNLDNLN